jgi:hypothetical protein
LEGAGAPYNVNYWAIPAPVVTTDNVSYSINKDGVLSGYFGFTLSDNGTAPALTNAVGYSTLNDAAAPYVYTYTAYAADNNSTVGYKQASFSRSGITPGFTWYYRAGSDFRGWGAENSFTLTAPVSATAAATNITWDGSHKARLNGNLTSLGDASSTYVRFRYSNDPAMVSNLNYTTEQSKTATGTYFADISGYSPAGKVYYQTVTRIGTALYYSATANFTPGATGSSGSGMGAWIIFYFVPIILACGIVFLSFKEGSAMGVLVGVVIGLIGVVLVNILFG